MIVLTLVANPAKAHDLNVWVLPGLDEPAGTAIAAGRTIANTVHGLCEIERKAGFAGTRRPGEKICMRRAAIREASP